METSAQTIVLDNTAPVVSESKPCVCDRCGKRITFNTGLLPSAQESLCWCHECMDEEKDLLAKLRVHTWFHDTCRHQGEGDYWRRKSNNAAQLRDVPKKRQPHISECDHCGKTLDISGFSIPYGDNKHLFWCMECIEANDALLADKGIAGKHTLSFKTPTFGYYHRSVPKLQTIPKKLMDNSAICGSCNSPIPCAQVAGALHWCQGCLRKYSAQLTEKGVPYPKIHGDAKGMDWLAETNIKAAKEIVAKDIESQNRKRVKDLEEQKAQELENIKVELAKTQKKLEEAEARIKNDTATQHMKCECCEKLTTIILPKGDGVALCKLCIAEKATLLKDVPYYDASYLYDTWWNNMESMEPIRRLLKEDREKPREQPKSETIVNGSCDHCGITISNIRSQHLSAGNIYWCKNCATTDHQLLVDNQTNQYSLESLELFGYDRWINPEDVKKVKALPKKQAAKPVVAEPKPIATRTESCDHCGSSISNIVKYDASTLFWCKDCVIFDRQLLLDAALSHKLPVYTLADLETWGYERWGKESSLSVVKAIPKKQASKPVVEEIKPAIKQVACECCEALCDDVQPRGYDCILACDSCSSKLGNKTGAPASKTYPRNWSRSAWGSFINELKTEIKTDKEKLKMQIPCYCCDTFCMDRRAGAVDHVMVCASCDVVVCKKHQETTGCLVSQRSDDNGRSFLLSAFPEIDLHKAELKAAKESEKPTEKEVAKAPAKQISCYCCNVSCDEQKLNPENQVLLCAKCDESVFPSTTVVLDTENRVWNKKWLKKIDPLKASITTAREKPFEGYAADLKSEKTACYCCGKETRNFNKDRDGKDAWYNWCSGCSRNVYILRYPYDKEAYAKKDDIWFNDTASSISWLPALNQAREEFQRQTQKTLLEKKAMETVQTIDRTSEEVACHCCGNPTTNYNKGKDPKAMPLTNCCAGCFKVIYKKYYGNDGGTCKDAATVGLWLTEFDAHKQELEVVKKTKEVEAKPTEVVAETSIDPKTLKVGDKISITIIYDGKEAKRKAVVYSEETPSNFAGVVLDASYQSSGGKSYRPENIGTVHQTAALNVGYDQSAKEDLGWPINHITKVVSVNGSFLKDKAEKEAKVEEDAKALSKKLLSELKVGDKITLSITRADTGKKETRTAIVYSTDNNLERFLLDSEYRDGHYSSFIPNHTAGIGGLEKIDRESAKNDRTGWCMTETTRILSIDGNLIIEQEVKAKTLSKELEGKLKFGDKITLSITNNDGKKEKRKAVVFDAHGSAPLFALETPFNTHTNNSFRPLLSHRTQLDKLGLNELADKKIVWDTNSITKILSIDGNLLTEKEEKAKLEAQEKEESAKKLSNELKTKLKVGDKILVSIKDAFGKEHLREAMVFTADHGLINTVMNEPFDVDGVRSWALSEINQELAKKAGIAINSEDKLGFSVVMDYITVLSVNGNTLNEAKEKVMEAPKVKQGDCYCCGAVCDDTRSSMECYWQYTCAPCSEKLAVKEPSFKGVVKSNGWLYLLNGLRAELRNTPVPAKPIEKVAVKDVAEEKPKPIKPTQLDYATLQPGDKIEVCYYHDVYGRPYLGEAYVLSKSEQNEVTVVFPQYNILRNGNNEVSRGWKLSPEQLGQAQDIDAIEEWVKADLSRGYVLDDGLYASRLIKSAQTHKEETEKEAKEQEARYQMQAEEDEEIQPATFQGLKLDLTKASYRVAANQITKGVKAGLLLALKNEGVEGGKLQAIAEMLETDFGAALVSALLGYGITYFPNLGEDPRAQKLAREFRVEGMSGAGNALADNVFKHLLPVMNDAMKSLPPLPVSEAKAEEPVIKKPAKKKTAPKPDGTQPTVQLTEQN